MKKIIALLLVTIAAIHVFAQTENKIRPLTMADYEKAKTFKVSDLDNDTYIKLENKYVLDRYAMRKPYFVTGSDGLKKRIDLYTLYSKDSMQEIGTVIYYTSEKGKLYTAVQPSFPSDSAVWNAYFTDIDNINKEEANYILKISYILSKEFSFQLYKSLNKNVKDEDGTYGMDICFPGSQLVAMADGSEKLLKDILPGDEIITRSSNGETVKQQVKELVKHPARNYAITSLLLVHAEECANVKGYNIRLETRLIEATPNHPVETITSKKEISRVQEGETMLCYNEATKRYEPFVVLSKTESAKGIQPVYNIAVNGGENFMINDVLVRQK
ncbi:Hint domain-containing protein [Parafilimonas sp.]|uniref:Hint domain-containing protein n=1 Tax=Parafilimonas sp. TaxID=1969739 RepID=UPI0039E707FE